MKLPAPVASAVVRDSDGEKINFRTTGRTSDNRFLNAFAGCSPGPMTPCQGLCRAGERARAARMYTSWRTI